MPSVSDFSEDEIIVLRTIHAAKRATSESLAKQLGEPYTPQDLSLYLTLLEQRKLLSKVHEFPPTYELSTGGLITIGVLPESARKVFELLPQDRCFVFYTGIGPDNFTRLSACSLSDFVEKAKNVNIKSLEFHLSRGDIANWLRDVLGEDQLAAEMRLLGKSRLRGDPLRNRALYILNARIKKLTTVKG